MHSVIETNVADAETSEGALGARLFVQWLCGEMSRDLSSRCFPFVFELNPSCVNASANIIVFFKCVHCSFGKIMSGLSAEMLTSIISHLTGQGLTLQQGNNSNSSNVDHSGLSIASTIPIVNEDEVLVGKDEFTMEQLLSKRKRNGKATQAQQTSP